MHGSTLIFHSGSTKPYSLTQKYGNVFGNAAREWFSLDKAEKAFSRGLFLWAAFGTATVSVKAFMVCYHYTLFNRIVNTCGFYARRSRTLYKISTGPTTGIMESTVKRTTWFSSAYWLKIR